MISVTKAVTAIIGNSTIFGVLNIENYIQSKK